MSFTRYFEILGVNPNSSFEQIRLAYKDLIKVWHPDRFSNDPRLQLKAQEKLKEVIIAYKALVSYFEEQRKLAEKKQRLEEERLHIIAQQKKMEEKRGSEEERNKKIQGHLATCQKYLKEKKYKDALLEADKVVELSPNIASGYNIRGNVYFFMEKYQEALNEYNRAIEVDSKDGRFLFNRSLVFEKLGNPKQSREDMKSAARLGDREAQLWFSSRLKRW